ncbi:hypothetical protein [Oceanivirga salmonicida]|uniref:hypothetical protein n=1 Tax=Oceanivirga salmonicida TaxID=1769291 RepID=UPI00082EEA87|nr:hypothetical protein [Oceanivirga salmonicida]
MKKIIVLMYMFLSISAFSEWNIKTGFDVYVDSMKINEKPTMSNVNGMGFSIGTEYIPFSIGISVIGLELGFGAEYNYGITASYFKIEKLKEFIPIYLVGRVNLFKNKNINLFVSSRFGGVAVRKSTETKFNGGVYYGLGLGFAYKSLITEFLYDGAYVSTTKSFDNKFGIKAGFRI